MPLFYWWRNWAESSDGWHRNGVRGNLMKHLQGRWIFCAAVSSGSRAGAQEKRGPERSHLSLVSYLPASLPRGRAPADRSCQGTHTATGTHIPLPRTQPLRRLQRTGLFSSSLFFCVSPFSLSHPTPPPPSFLSSQSSVHSKGFT